MNSRYHILWIDDEWEKMTSFKKNCLFEYQMELHPFKTQKEGLDEYAKHPDFYDAILLDGEIFDDCENEVADVSNLQKALFRIASFNNAVPYFISTGKAPVLSNPLLKINRIYEKNTDDAQLCHDIIVSIEETPNRQIVNKYSELFTKLSTPIYEEMISIIKIHECHETNNADVFNKIRKVLDWIMQSVSDYGLLATPFNGTNLNDCSRFLGNTKLNEYIPTYIQRHLFSLVTIANEGSHRQVTDELVKNGNAPYLVSATIFELINVLLWFHNLPQDQETKDKIDSIVSNIALELCQKSARNR